MSLFQYVVALVLNGFISDFHNFSGYKFIYFFRALGLFSHDQTE
jgi:hypothetical protein